MGGQDTTRGILVQALMALLDALGDSGWDTFTIEPNLASEKVDILWSDRRGLRRATQVKSSRNQIALGDAEQWSKDLKESREAAEYELILIGHVAKGIIGKSDFDGVAVRIMQLHLQTFLEQGAHRIDKHLASQGIRGLTVEQRELLVRVLVAELLLFAIEGVEVSRVEFDQMLASWVQDGFLALSSPTGSHDASRRGCHIELYERDVPGWGISNGTWQNCAPAGRLFLRFPLFIHNSGDQPGTIQKLEVVDFQKETDLIRTSDAPLGWSRQNKPIQLSTISPQGWIDDVEATLTFELSESDLEALAQRLHELQTPFTMTCRYVYTGPGGKREGQLVIEGSFAPVWESFVANWRGSKPCHRYVDLAQR